MEGWHSSRNDVTLDLQLYWIFRYELAVIDGIAMKGKGIIKPVALQSIALEQLHIKHMLSQHISSRQTRRKAIGRKVE